MMKADSSSHLSFDLNGFFNTITRSKSLSSKNVSGSLSRKSTMLIRKLSHTRRNLATKKGPLPPSTLKYLAGDSRFSFSSGASSDTLIPGDLSSNEKSSPRPRPKGPRPRPIHWNPIDFMESYRNEFNGVEGLARKKSLSVRLLGRLRPGSATSREFIESRRSKTKQNEMRSVIQMLESLEIQPSPENEAKIKLLKSYLHGGSSCTLESLSLPSDANSFASTPQRFYGDSSLELNPTSSLRKSAVELFDKLSDHHAHQSLGNKKKPPPPPPLKSVKSSLSVISLKDIEPLEA